MLRLPLHLLILTCVVLLSACGPGDEGGGDARQPTTGQDERAATTVDSPADDVTSTGGGTTGTGNSAAEDDNAADTGDGAVVSPAEDLVADGNEIGSKARTILAVGSYSDISSFERHGIEVGASSGQCHVPDPDPVRADVAAAIEKSDPKAGQVTLSGDDLLVARCGDTWYALASWDAGGSMSLDQFSAGPGEPWKPSGEGAYPGCEGPADLAKVWEIDRSYCTDG